MSWKKIPTKVCQTVTEYPGNPDLFINQFCSEIFIINLKGKTERFEKVTKQFFKTGVKFKRFEAVDGRCEGRRCASVKSFLRKKYKVNIARDVKPQVASLVIGTILILREMVKNKWPAVLICEDDINFSRNMAEKFKKGMEELYNSPKKDKWDLVYLGAGGQAGYRGVSEKKTSKNKHMTSLSIVSKDYNWYVQHPDDLRNFANKEQKDAMRWGKILSIPIRTGGTWCYMYSLKGAKRVLKMFENTVYDHIDWMLYAHLNDMNVLAFDPPIIYHEAGAFRPDSDIPWEW